MFIRPAIESDAEGIGLVNVRSWQGTYRGHLPSEYLNRLDPAHSAQGWRRALRETGDRSGVLVADDSGIVGFVSFGRSRDTDADPAHTGEVFSIYLMPEMWGTGVGRQLMAAAVEHLYADGYTEATLWVLDANARAREFYGKAGWRHDGATQIEEIGGFPVTEVRYRRSLP